jgi:hypothetical protein
MLKVSLITWPLYKPCLQHKSQRLVLLQWGGQRGCPTVGGRVRLFRTKVCQESLMHRGAVEVAISAAILQGRRD